MKLPGGLYTAAGRDSSIRATAIAREETMRSLFLALAGLMIAGGAQGATIIHAGSLIVDPREEAVSERSLILENGEITEIADGFVEGGDGDTVIDLSEAVVLPGLIDLHTHITNQLNPKRALQRMQWSEVDQAMSGARYALKTLKAGFTTIRNVGGDPKAVFGLRDAIAKGWISGPRIVAAGSTISGTGGHGDIDGYKPEILELETPKTICDGPYDCRRAVRTAVKYGADVIKITATGGVLSDAATGLAQQMKMDELKEIMTTADSLGRKVAAHAHGADGINAALEAGVDTIEHGSMLNDKSIRLFKETGAWLVPTLLAGKAVIEADQEHDFLPPAIKEKAKGLPEKVMANIAEAYEAGVKIAFGTDSGVSPHGENAREFALLREIGMSNEEALTAATVHAATVLDKSQSLGTLEAGKRADIIAVADNPLADVTTLTEVGFVMKGGEVIKNGF